jgi:hypothetical protein
MGQPHEQEHGVRSLSAQLGFFFVWVGVAVMTVPLVLPVLLLVVVDWVVEVLSVVEDVLDVLEAMAVGETVAGGWRADFRGS